MNIKYRIKEYRIKNKLSIIELSKKSGVCKSNISSIENGKIKKPSFKDILLITRTLNIKIENIFEIND